MTPSIFLYVCITGAAAGSPNWYCERHPVESFPICAAQLGVMRIEPKLPNSTVDKFNQVVAYCSGDQQWQDGNGKWREGEKP